MDIRRAKKREVLPKEVALELLRNDKASDCDVIEDFLLVLDALQDLLTLIHD